MTEEKKVQTEPQVEEAPVAEEQKEVEVDIIDDVVEKTAAEIEEETSKGKKPLIIKEGRLPRPREFESAEWVPRTKLGELVKSGKITTIHDALTSGYPLREPQIVDLLMGESLVDEVIKVNMVQRMTDSGRRTRFSINVVVGNGDGIVGMGAARGKEVGPTIKKAIDNAKLNLVELVRGCGSWECGCMNPHSLPMRVTGKAGSTTVTLNPAPTGVGLAVGDVAKKVLKLAGISDAWGFSRGQTKTTVNNARAVMEALKETTRMKVQKDQRLELKHLTGPGNPIPVKTEERGDRR